MSRSHLQQAYALPLTESCVDETTWAHTSCSSARNRHTHRVPNMTIKRRRTAHSTFNAANVLPLHNKPLSCIARNSSSRSERSVQYKSVQFIAQPLPSPCEVLLSSPSHPEAGQSGHSLSLVSLFLVPLSRSTRCHTAFLKPSCPGTPSNTTMSSHLSRTGMH